MDERLYRIQARQSAGTTSALRSRGRRARRPQGVLAVESRPARARCRRHVAHQPGRPGGKRRRRRARRGRASTLAALTASMASGATEVRRVTQTVRRALTTHSRRAGRATCWVCPGKAPHSQGMRAIGADDARPRAWAGPGRGSRGGGGHRGYFYLVYLHWEGCGMARALLLRFHATPRWYRA